MRFLDAAPHDDGVSLELFFFFHFCLLVLLACYFVSATFAGFRGGGLSIHSFIRKGQLGGGWNGGAELAINKSE